MSVATDTPMPTDQQTVGVDKDDRPKIHITSRGHSFHHNGGCHADFHGLDSKELELLEGAAHGHQWITVSHLGRLRAIPTYKKLPAPWMSPNNARRWRLIDGQVKRKRAPQ